jgi:CDP-6-deoxy-D-xylo-4-hexulose-3-dehydrase
LLIMVNTNAPFRRRDITQYLEGAGVETRPIVAGNVARHPVARLFKDFNQEALPGADAVHERGFYIGLSPVQDEASMARLLDCFQRFLSQY